MSRLKVMLGALFAAGLCICAIGASSASALTMEECATATEASTNVICDGGAKKWLPVNGTVLATPIAGQVSTLFTIVGGVEFEISCKKLSGSGTSENVETGTDMHVTGTGIVVKYEECKVVKPTQCTVPATLTTNSLKATTVNSTTEMAQKYEPTTKEGPFIEIEVTGATCPAALKGVKKVTGFATARSTVAQEAAGEQEFNIPREGAGSGELKYAGQNAEFKSKNTFSTAGGTQVFPHTSATGS